MAKDSYTEHLIGFEALTYNSQDKTEHVDDNQLPVFLR